MRNTIFGRRGLPLMAAVLALTLPGVRSARAVADGSATSLLSSELPPRVTLRNATNDQLDSAVRAAVKAHPEMAPNIVRAAILARTPRREGKELDAKDGATAPCPAVVGIVRSAEDADPGRASDITQVALSMCPDCADSLNSVVGNQANNGVNDINDPGLYNTPNDFYGGFGVGFGPGFPGSPGFTGSAPSGAIALPPVVPAVTSVRG